MINLTLNNGVTVPTTGPGVFHSDPEGAAAAVEAALIVTGQATSSPSSRRGTAVGVALLGAALTSCAAAEPPTPATTGDAATVSNYQDGQYDATGWYGSLPSHHDVTLTIRDDTVTAVQITTPADDPTSLGYQQRFAAALPGEIIGRDIDTLRIDRLAGASGCSEGFMDALAKIKDAATLS